MSKFVRPAAEGADPFGTARLRRGVLDAWATSPARFREDANAEEELVLGGYRDRLVVELAQNAADAAARAGVPGRFRLTLRDGVLAAANTGAPLDAAGVESLATLRASAKRDSTQQAVGRFGVGFAAVLSVTDEPAVLGRHGGVRWSLAEARDLADETARHSPGLGDEIRRRDGHVPLLRLPFAAEGTAPDPYDTVVVLPLRDAAAADLVERLLAAVDDALLLALPGLDEVVVDLGGEVRTLSRRTEGALTVVEDSRDGTTGWRTASAHGPLTPDLLAGRPVEERLRPHWSLTWAVPVDADGGPARPRTSPVVHAPTPSDEPLGVPALLIASFPLDSTRRHAAAGPLTDFLVQRAADAYAGLLADWRPVTAGALDLVPGALGRGELDGALRQAILDRLPRTSFLPPAAEPAEGHEELPESLRPRDAEVVEGAGAETVRVLAEVLPTLLPAGLERRAELRTLGVARVPLTDAVDRLAGLEKDPAWWRRLYDSLAGVDPDRLSGLPVPLAGGPAQAFGTGQARTTIGPRQVLLPTPDGAGTDLGVLARLGLKVAHPDAVHPLLEKLGALPATPRAVLTTPQVRAAVAASLDDDAGAWDEDTPDAEELADTVLALVRDAGLEPGDEPWLGALALPDEDGEPAPAGELVLPGSAFHRVMREGELACVDTELADRWGEQPLAACGVLAGFALVRATDVVLDPDELEPREGDFAETDDPGLLDAVDVWCEDILDRFPDSPVPPVATELVAVRDLDLVDDDHWPRVLPLLSQPPLRDAVVQPVRILLPDGTHEVVRSYTAWWLRGHPVLDGRRPAGLLAAGGDPLLRGLYDEADATGFGDEQVLRALGVRTSVAALLDEPGGAAELLDRLADPERTVTAAQLHGLYGALAELDPEQVTLPDDLRAVVDGEVRVVDAADAVVVDSPDLLPFTEGVPLLPVRPSRAAELADLFQVRRLSESVTGEVTSEGAEHDVPEAVRVLLGPRTPDTYVEHEELVVDGVGIDWRLTDDGVLHAATLEGVAAGLAWAAGQWPRRFEVAALLEDPSRTRELARDRWFD
ncbi:MULTISPECIES: sacsin N-terminal ATP-binding-like domain-containing protein [unclassified Streptomyces]|uniref:sacsin N-terminal ATP-binding-like domain-containing protein n=1 Tax=unclassified Streptomyces TaxID=2593676 RepID=UPI001F0348D3|nr:MULTISPECIES: molecular chaperone Hsp90 [unclassified Streptomyces]MCH0562022.1 molecular chaperone Hsp90 [Streptomyces sp. MUM 2J]MCH0568027.1 molecular chaperone Hsp90 [Streptomyces sp. MUM 136J]